MVQTIPGLWYNMNMHRRQRRLKDPTHRGGSFSKRLVAPPKLVTMAFEPGDTGTCAAQASQYLCIGQTPVAPNARTFFVTVGATESFMFSGLRLASYSNKFVANIDVDTYVKGQSVGGR